MKRLFQTIRRFARSLGGRIALILAFGISCTAIGSLLVAEQARLFDIERIRSERVVASAVDMIERLHKDPVGTEQSLRADIILGAHFVRPGLTIKGALDTRLNAMLAERLPVRLRPKVVQVPVSVCYPDFRYWEMQRTAGFDPLPFPDCWLVSFNRGDGRSNVALDLPRVRVPPSSTLNPVYLLILVAASGLLSILVAGLATAPLRRLASASEAFARSIDAEPISEQGPSDVRAALATFNVMQERVREGLRERTRLLASISHDLQTPLTRLRLRLEQVEDEPLRARLVTDLSATLLMVRRGLDLARSSESGEDWSIVDIDSLLSSIAEDAAEFGQAVAFLGGCGAHVRVKPDALARCIGNLVENALKYAGNAQIECRKSKSNILVVVSDDGPGIAEDLMLHIFQPFVRGPSNGAHYPAGTGIGLAIAKAQAEAIGGRLTIRNRSGSGVEAVIAIPQHCTGNR